MLQCLPECAFYWEHNMVVALICEPLCQTKIWNLQFITERIVYLSPKTKIKFTILYCRLIQSTSASLFSLSKMFEALMSLWMILLGQSWWRYCNPFATPTATLNLIFHSKHSEPEMLNVTSISHVRHQPLTLLLVHW